MSEGLSAKQADHVYSKCKNEEVLCTKQVYSCKSSDEEKSDSHLNPYECVVFNDFELFKVHTECAEIENWSHLSTKIDYVECNGKALPANRVRFNPAKENVLGI